MPANGSTAEVTTVRPIISVEAGGTAAADASPSKLYFSQIAIIATSRLCIYKRGYEKKEAKYLTTHKARSRHSST